MRFDNRRGEHGFALILALLTLMLLTFLGLTLAATTSSELQIASNQRWAAQAYYNAEAGIEAAKIALKNYTGSLDLIPLLPNARGAWVPTSGSIVALPAHPNGWSDTTDSWGLPLRNWENSTCDTLGGNVGYGTILVARPSVDVNGDAGGAPLQYVTQVGDLPLQGAFTVWVRRAPVINPDGTVSDDTSNTEALVTSEGVAPYSGASAGLRICTAQPCGAGAAGKTEHPGGAAVRGAARPDRHVVYGIGLQPVLAAHEQRARRRVWRRCQRARRFWRGSTVTGNRTSGGKSHECDTSGAVLRWSGRPGGAGARLRRPSAARAAGERRHRPSRGPRPADQAERAHRSR